MSELSKCNYCTEQWMIKEAQRRNTSLVYGHTAEGWISIRYGDEEKPSVYFLELTDHCVC